MTVQQTIQAQIDSIKTKAATDVAELEAELAKGESWLTVEWDHAVNFAENIYQKLKAKL